MLGRWGRMGELARQYPRYGYRRIRIFLGRDGHAMSASRAYRLWQAAGLQVPRRRPRKRIATGRPRPNAPTGANQVWSYDFVFDWCANGQRLKCLTVTDEWTKEGLAIEVGGRIRSQRVIEVLARLVSERGAPLYLRSDNGPEFVSRALLKWIVDPGIATALIDPGKPWQNGMAESFNGKFRDECLSLEWFRSRAEAKAVIESWRRHYNEVRPHSSLGYLTPAEFAARLRSQDAAPAQATGRSAAVCGASVGSLFTDPTAYDAWATSWRRRLADDGEATCEHRAAAMRAVNPAFIPRNHLVEEALSAAVNNGDLSAFEKLLAVLSRPYDDQPSHRPYAEPPRPDQIVRQTFCGT
jgi:putative transposase